MTSAASQLVMCEFSKLRDFDKAAADLCNRIRLLDDQHQSVARGVTSAESRGDLASRERMERECARSATSFHEALFKLGSTRAASLIGIGLKASTLAHFLPRFRDEAAEEHLLLVAAFADEVLAFYPPASARREQDDISSWLDDDLRALTFSIADYISKREALLVSFAAVAQNHDPGTGSEVPGEAEYLDREERFAAQLSKLARQDFRSVTELLALAGIVAGLARQDPGAAISSSVIVLGLKLCDTVLLQPVI